MSPASPALKLAADLAFQPEPDAVERAQAAAAKAEARLRAAIDALPEGVVFLDEEGRYILWNQRYAEIYHESADLFAPGRKLEDTLRIGVARGAYPDAVGREEAWLAERLAQMKSPHARLEQRLADGRWILIEERKTQDGGHIGIRVDITEMKARETFLQLLFDDNPVPMFLYEPRTWRVIAANRAAIAHYGYSAFQMDGMSVLQIYDLDEQEALRRARDSENDPRLPEGVWRQRKASGAPVEAAIFCRELDHGGRPTMLLACVDVTERRRAEARVAHMARHDALTNLPNRMLYRERVEEQFARLKEGGQRVTDKGFSILLIDLDHFKQVNDTLGHSVGDRLLQEVAIRLQACLPPGDMVARLGGDEFVIVHTDPDRASIIALAEKLRHDVDRPYDLDNHHVSIGLSVGVAMAPEDGADPDTLLKNADLALYSAKAEGRGVFRFFEAEMDAQLQARRRLEAELRTAIAEGQLCVHYQPLYDLKQARICGVEALVRWNHPTRGLVAPGEFIPLAEEIGLIGPIGQYVLNQACRDAVAWPDHIKVAVNLSPVQFRGGGLKSIVTQALARSGLDPARLELEITEALLMEKDETVVATLNALRGLGVGISMDDFGTGYSSLNYLRSFPFTKIKIDQSFVKDLGSSADSQAIVRAVVGLGASLGMRVTAEGVETAEILDRLVAEGCTEAQGYHFGAPQSFEAFSEMLKG
jgi:diguanylate cyclase (GGDEF)-like protein/PAS domain S-box-containing protein